MKATPNQISGALLKLASLLKFAPDFSDREKLATWVDSLNGITVEQITSIFGKFKRECTSWPALSEFLDLMDGGIGDQATVSEIIAQQIIAHATRRTALSLEASEVLAAMGGLRGIEWLDASSSRCRERLLGEVRAAIAARAERLVIPLAESDKLLRAAELPPALPPAEFEPIPALAEDRAFQQAVESIGQPDENLERLRKLFGRFAVCAPGTVAGGCHTDAARDRARQLEQIGSFRAANKTERIEAMKILIQSMERK